MKRNKLKFALYSFIAGVLLSPVFYLAYLKSLDMYDLITVPDTKVHAYCMGVRQWGADEVCHCYEIHGRACYGDKAMGSDLYKQMLLRDRDGR